METDSSFSQKLILLSDIDGVKKGDWMEYYKKLFREHFETKMYDSRKLAEIDLTLQNKEEIHQKFLNGGIERAATNLQKMEKEPFAILGFSIGGTIGWKAALGNNTIIGLTAISSTRLRYEKEKSEIPIETLFGGMDSYKPSKNWFDDMKLPENLISGEDHEFYKKKVWAERIGENLISTEK